MQQPTFSLFIYKGIPRIKVEFENNPAWNKRMRQVEGAKWSATFHCWHIPDTTANRIRCHLPIENNATIDQAKGVSAPANNIVAQPRLSQVNWNHLLKFVQMLQLKSYSPSTIRTYRNELHGFLLAIRDIDAETLTTDRVKDYLQYCHVHLNLSEHTIHSRMNALKFFYEQLLGRENFFGLYHDPKNLSSFHVSLTKTSWPGYSMHFRIKSIRQCFLPHTVQV